MQKSGMLAAGVENLDMEAVARVAQKAVLKEICLFDAKINREPVSLSPDALTIEHQCSTKIIPSQKNDDVLLVLCTFRVAAFRRKSPDKIIMSIEATFCASYVLRPLADFKSEDIEHFSKINPIYNTWPFWREFVHSMTTRMGFPALTVPLLKIMPKKSAMKARGIKTVKKESIRRKKLDG
jgi:preprotein translocase subunit SecB